MEKLGVEKTGQGVGRTWRRLLIAAKWTVGVLAVLGLLFVGINWFDEDLSPEARALLIAPHNPYPPEENLYLALLGFDAKEGVSPITAGQAKVAIYEKEIAAVRKDPQHVLPIFPDAPWQNKEKLEFQGKVDFCLPLTKSCLTNETATPSIYLISPYAPSPVRQLYLVNIALRTQSGVRAQRNAAIADLLADIRTWRLELTGSGSLISKMLAVAYLQGDYALLADIIADSKLELEDGSPKIQSTLELSDDDWKIGKIVAFEYRISDFMWDELRVTKGKRLLVDSASEESWWEPAFDRISSLFIKINATQNLQARLATQQQKMVEADPAKFFVARDAYQLWLRDNLEFRMHYIYNPFGKSLIGIATSPYENYYLRAFDGAAFQRLVRLGYEIRSQKIEDKAVPLFIQKHPEWASHPVDGRPFIWDEKKREIAVQTLGQQPKDRRFSIRVWSAASRK